MRDISDSSESSEAGLVAWGAGARADGLFATGRTMRWVLWRALNARSELFDRADLWARSACDAQFWLPYRL